MHHDANTLQQRIINCRECSRLRLHCEKIATEKKKMFSDWVYWGRPVPNFGDTSAQLLIVGLAPAAHGANRTGRMFTGDQSGVWLYRALHRAGFATQAESQHKDDGLRLINCLITSVCHCAPPDNKPSTEEINNCSDFLLETFNQIKNKKIILALGQLAWVNTWSTLCKQKPELKKHASRFSHGVEVVCPDGLYVLGSYHPSQQNTFTGKLTQPAFDAIFQRCREILNPQG